MPAAPLTIIVVGGSISGCATVVALTGRSSAGGEAVGPDGGGGEQVGTSLQRVREVLGAGL